MGMMEREKRLLACAKEMLPLLEELELVTSQWGVSVADFRIQRLEEKTIAKEVTVADRVGDGGAYLDYDGLTGKWKVRS